MISVLTPIAHAQSTNDFTYQSALFSISDFSCAPGPTFLPCYFNALFTFAVQFAIAFAVVMVMVGGFQWLMAIGNQSKISNAKSTITGAVIGLILALTSYLLLSQINSNLVNLGLDYTNPVVIEPLPGADRGNVINQCEGRSASDCSTTGPGLCIYTPDEGCQPYYFYDYEALSKSQAEHRLSCCIYQNASKKIVSSKLIALPENTVDSATFCKTFVAPTGEWSSQAIAGANKKISDFLRTPTTALNSPCWATINNYICDDPAVTINPQFFQNNYCQ